MFDVDFNSEIVTVVGTDYYVLMTKEQDHLIIEDFGKFTDNIKLFEAWCKCIDAHHKIMSLPYRKDTNAIFLKRGVFKHSVETFEGAIAILSQFYLNEDIINEKMEFLINSAKTNIEECTNYYYNHLNDLISYKEAGDQIIVRFETTATIIHKLILDYPFSFISGGEKML